MVKPGRYQLLLFSCLPFSVWSANFEATVDRHQLTVNEPVTLTLTLTNADVRLRAEGTQPNIDLSPLHRDFDVGMPKTDFRYNVYQGRGRSSSELKVVLHPKSTGVLSIPAFELEGEHTNTITLEVKDPAQDGQPPEVFVKAGTLQPQMVWVGQQLVVYLDIYHRVALDKAELSDILETEPTRIELLPHWQLPQHREEVQHQGYDYQVQRMGWALYPQQAGEISVYLPSTSTLTQTQQARNFPHQLLTFNVQALPSNLPTNTIIGRPEVRMSPLEKTLNLNELNAWSISIDAPVEISGLPDYLPIPEVDKQLQIFPDKVKRDALKTHLGISDVGQYTLSILPKATGEFEISSISIPYFDTGKGELAFVTVPEQSIQVIANNGSRQDATTGLKTLSSVETSNTDNATRLWQGISLTLLLSNIASLALWRRKSKKQSDREAKLESPKTAPQSHNTPVQALLNHLNESSLQNLIEHWQMLDISPEKAQRLIELTKNIQQMCYAETASGEPEATEQALKQACQGLLKESKGIIKTASENATNNPWLPENTLK